MKHTHAAKRAACVLGALWGWSGFVQAAGAPAWPADWTAFGPVPPVAGMEKSGQPGRGQLLPGSALASIPAALEIGGQSYTGQPVSPDAEGRFDLGALFGGVERGKTVYLLAPLKAEQAATLTVGAGADWWMQWWLDGAPVFDTLERGNRNATVARDNHLFTLALAPGAHVLAVAVISGSGGFRLAVDEGGRAGTEFATAMRAGREQRKRYQANCITEAIGLARAEFQKAVGQAATDAEKAEALLALADAWRADAQGTDPASVRRLYEQAGALEQAAPRMKGMAALGVAEMYRLEKDYARALESTGQAAQMPDPDVRQRAVCAAARIHLLEGNTAAAREALERLLAAPWEEQDEPLRDEARALLEVVGLMELRAVALTEPPRDREADASRGADAAAPAEPPDMEYVVRHLRPDRPRLFLNRDILEAVRRNGLSPDQQTWLQALRTRVDRYPPPPALDDARASNMLSDAGGIRYMAADAPRVNDGPWPYYAAHAALVYLLTGERGYCNRAVAFLRTAAAEWDLIRAHGRIPYSRNFTKLVALSAYDWLFNDMTPAERAEIGQPLFRSLHAFYWYWRSQRSGQWQRRPYPYVTSMSYSDNAAGWYLGLVFAGAGIEGASDDVCLELMRDEYQQYLGYFQTELPEPDGVFLQGAIGYFTQKLDVKVNFLDAWQTALGTPFSRYVPRFAGFGYYTLWNAIHPGEHHPAGPLHYGWSDAYHDTNRMGHYHAACLMRLADLYAGVFEPERMAELTALAQVQALPDYACFLEVGQYLTPASPLRMAPRPMPDAALWETLSRLPRARHFPDPVGQTFMNSGWGSNDTYALFIAGRQFTSRKHYDENHFTIYKKGFLAMDTGARGAGYDSAVDETASGVGHGINYYYDTIAHNGVLIYMDGEQLPGFWGSKADVNTGGMNQNFGAQVRAFETDALYTYVASDATSCYHSNKAAEVARQFLFVYPDWFVVFDRVQSKVADQKKTWLFHTQMEPVETGDLFRAEHGGGAVLVRTLLPKDRASEKIGGPGKEFWAGGRNWPLNKFMTGYMVKDGQPTPDRNLFGQWRMEISPVEARTRDLFLHFIQVGDKAALSAMTPSTLIEDDQTAGVEFQASARTVRVVFHKGGDVGGHIRIAEGGAVLADRPLAVTVQRQDGLALAK